MIRRIGNFFADWAQKYIPDPFVFAIVLTFLTLFLGMACTGSSVIQMIEYWARGFWELLTFGMQMCLILVTGHALAASRPVRALLRHIAGLPRTPGGAAGVVALVAALFGLVNWGLGIIVGAFFALEVGKQAESRGLRLHFPLIGAAGYAGLLVWHGGWSGSIPLLIATPGHFLEEEIGVIPVSQTIFSPANLILSLALLVAVPALFSLLHPRESSRIISVPAPREPNQDTPFVREKGLVYLLEESPWLSILITVLGFSYLLHYFFREGLALNINIMNFLFLFTGIAFHGNPRSYLRAVAEGTKACAGIIIQFPFYAGIMGMMKYSGLVMVISQWCVRISSTHTYPILTFLSAGLVNLFVPSGGGQWAVQGPVMVKAAEVLHFSIPRTAMAVAYGDEFTNMFQPFWALPLLGITGLKARDIMGYTMLVMLLSAPIFFIVLLVF